MGRPIRRRDADDYQRDAEALGRLHIALNLDRRTTGPLVAQALAETEKLQATLLSIVRSLRQEETIEG